MTDKICALNVSSLAKLWAESITAWDFSNYKGPFRPLIMSPITNLLPSDLYPLKTEILERIKSMDDNKYTERIPLPNVFKNIFPNELLNWIVSNSIILFELTAFNPMLEEGKLDTIENFRRLRDMIKELEMETGAHFETCMKHLETERGSEQFPSISEDHKKSTGLIKLIDLVNKSNNKLCITEDEYEYTDEYTPPLMYHSYGTDGVWREDGVLVAFKKPLNNKIINNPMINNLMMNSTESFEEIVLSYILRVAKKYGQGAIYKWTFHQSPVNQLIENNQNQKERFPFPEFTLQEYDTSDLHYVVILRETIPVDDVFKAVREIVLMKPEIGDDMNGTFPSVSLHPTLFYERNEYEILME